MTGRELLYVACGGALGAVARYVVSHWCEITLGTRFPWGTFLVNVVGCFLLGWLIEAAESSTALSQSMKLMLGTGFLGALTTFSTFGVQTYHAWQRSAPLAVVNVAANVLLGLLAAGLGIYAAGRLHSPIS